MRYFYFLLLSLIINVPLTGQSWLEQTTPTTQDLYDIHFISTSEGWAVGDAGVILHTTDGGATWASQSSGVTEDLKDVYFVNSNAGYASGGVDASGFYGIILKTTDGGNNWSKVWDSSFRRPNDIVFSDVNNGWFMGFGGSGLTPPLILKTTDGGANISDESPVSIENDVYEFHLFNMNTLVATMYSKIYKTTNGGSSWSAVYSSPTGMEEMNVIDFADNNTGYVLVSNSTTDQLVKSTDGGENWQPVKSNLGSYDFRDMEFLNEFNGVIAQKLGLMRTSDGGQTWALTQVNTQSGSSFEPMALSFYDKANGWTCGKGGYIFRFNDTLPVRTEKITELESKIEITPNPSDSHIFLNSRYITEPVQVQMFDMLGNRVFSDFDFILNQRIPLHYLPEGIYIVYVTYGNEQLKKKLLIQH